MKVKVPHMYIIFGKNIHTYNEETILIFTQCSMLKLHAIIVKFDIGNQKIRIHTCAFKQITFSIDRPLMSCKQHAHLQINQ